MFEPKMFIHIPKCAGTTIRLSEVLRGKVKDATPETHKSAEYTEQLHKTMRMNGEHHGNEHARWRDLSWQYQSLDCFAVARNPWDRVVSRYLFARKTKFVEKKSDAQDNNCATFEEFLDERHRWGNAEFYWHRAVKGWYPSFDHVCDEQGNLRCDMLRFEELDKDLCLYFKVPKMSRARNVTRMHEGTYRDFYNSVTIQIVADWYKKDIDMWGYDFDTGAQKNFWSESL